MREITEQGQRQGHRLPAEHEMIERYRVGRGTLREALHYLELQGVLEIRPGLGGGPVVRQPDARHLASTDGAVLGVDYPERRRKDVLAAHDRVCAALERRDPDLARREMAQHMENFLGYLDRNHPELLRRQLVWADFAD